MTTIQEREHQLVQFLESAMPTMRVAGSLGGHRASRREGVGATEVLVALREIAANGASRWEVEIANANPSPDVLRRHDSSGVLSVVESLRIALRGSPYATLGGRLRADPSSVYTWVELLEEPAAGARVHALLRHVLPLGELAVGIAQAQRTIEDIDLVGDPPEPGDLIVASDAIGLVSLGLVEYWEEGVLRVGDGPPRAMVAPIALYVAAQATILPVAVDELLDEDQAAFTSHGRTQSGHAVSARFAAPYADLRLGIPHLSQIAAYELRQWLAVHGGEPFLVVRAGGMVEEAMLLRLRDVQEYGRHSMELHLRIHELDDLSAWEVES